ncbi:MAG: hypothetical protein M9894_03115 [Planctomycetes bacterium]|nr:hypothetical protein [Planctomycetota bacterium]
MPGPLGLAEADLWGDPRAREDVVIDRLIDEGFLGVAVEAPARVTLGARATLPLVGVEAAPLSGAGGWAPVRLAAVACASALETREVRAALAVPPADAGPPSFPPEGDLPALEGAQYEMFEVDLRERLRLPWRPGTWVVGLLVREQVTNRVTVTLAPGAPGFVDPAVAALLSARPRPRYPQPVWPRPAPGKPLPAYAPRPDSPPVPEAPGIALAVERLVMDTDDAQVVVRGSFRLGVLEREVVRPGDPADAALLETLAEDARAEALRDGLAWQDPGDPEATAVVPITLVVTGAERPAPLVVRLQVPVRQPIDPTADAPEAMGHFALDLLAVEGGERLRGQTSFIYALCGDVLAGPAAVAVVDPRVVGGGGSA